MECHGNSLIKNKVHLEKYTRLFVLDEQGFINKYRILDEQGF
ncbi:hypothetical protein [Streptococcus phage phiLP081102]|nr:hypothetical protein [Streptococcus phage phiLP081102]